MRLSKQGCTEAGSGIHQRNAPRGVWLADWEGGSTFFGLQAKAEVMNYNELFSFRTCDPELFPFFDAFPPSVPNDSFFESAKRE